jgi:GH35 family endo-1,4-beta-xylanase
MSNKSELIKNYIITTAMTLNQKYPGIVNQNQIDKAIDMFTGSNESIEVTLNKIDALRDELITNYFANKQIQEINNLAEPNPAENPISNPESDDNEIYPFDLGQDQSGISLNIQVIELLSLVNCSNTTEIINFYQNCAQFPIKDQELITRLQQLPLEDAKKEIFNKYQATFLSSMTETDLTVVQKAEIKLKAIGISGIEKDNIVNMINSGNISGAITYLSSKYGKEVCEGFIHFMPIDIDNSKAITYEQAINLNDRIKNDETITSITSTTGNYGSVISYDSNGHKVFDPFYIDKAMNYCAMMNKHMRYHSLINYKMAEQYIKEGRTALDRQTILMDMQYFVNNSYNYIKTHNKTLNDGSMLIDELEVFNELAEYNRPVSEQNNPYNTIWQKQFNISTTDLVSMFANQPKLPGVRYIYNETKLNESSERRKKVNSTLNEIRMINPDLIDTFGDQMHFSDIDTNTPNGQKEIMAEMQLLSNVKSSGMNIQVTEASWNLSEPSATRVEQGIKNGQMNSKQVSDYKKQNISFINDAAATCGVTCDKLDYWAPTHVTDDALVRENQKNIKAGKPVHETLYGGVFGKCSKPNPNKLVPNQSMTKAKEKPMVRTLTKPNDNGYAITLSLTLIIGFLIVSAIIISILVYHNIIK